MYSYQGQPSYTTTLGNDEVAKQISAQIGQKNKSVTIGDRTIEAIPVSYDPEFGNSATSFMFKEGELLRHVGSCLAKRGFNKDLAYHFREAFRAADAGAVLPPLPTEESFRAAVNQDSGETDFSIESLPSSYQTKISNGIVYTQTKSTGWWWLRTCETFGNGKTLEAAKQDCRKNAGTAQ